MKTLKEIDREMNEFWDQNQHLFHERLEEIERAEELMVSCDMTPFDPLHMAELDRIREKYAPVLDRYHKLYWEKNLMLATSGYKLGVRKDEARSMIDLEHPRCPDGERTVKDDWDKRKDMFYGPGGKLRDEDKKIIMIPGVENQNRASSLM